MKCHKCEDEQITYYRQQRADGVWVVVARCTNGHSPQKGKPFYSTSDFDVMSLPPLIQEEKAYQPALIEREITQNIDEFMSLDIIEQRRQTFAEFQKRFPRLK